MNKIQCDGCRDFTPSYEVVNYGSLERGYRQLCNTCFNKEVATLGDLPEFEQIQFQPIVMTDVSGNNHEFHFQTRLMGTFAALDAIELIDEDPQGYRFQMIGDPEDDLMVLLGKLIERMRRALSTRHIEDTERGPTITDQQIVRGRVEWDEASDGRVPLLIIDGKKVTWEEMGQLLMSVEGWQFKLEFHDISEEI